MAELSGKIEYPGIRRQITANGDDPRVSYGVLSGPRNASGFRYPSDAVITVDGHGTYTIPKNTGIYIWQGSQAATDAAKSYQMDLTAKRWRIFYVPGAARLYACPEQDYAAVSGSTDVLRVEYQTQASMWRRSQIKFRPFICLSASPQVRAVSSLTAGFVDGPLASARFANVGNLASGGGTVYIMDIGNHAIRRLIGGAVDTLLVDADISSSVFVSGTYGIAVAPNGDLYYGTTTGLKVVRAGSSTPSTLLSSRHNVLAICVSPDGGTVFYFDNVFSLNPIGAQYYLFAVNPDGSGDRQYAGNGQAPSTGTINTLADYTDATHNASISTAQIPSGSGIVVDPTSGDIYLHHGIFGGLTLLPGGGAPVTRLTTPTDHITGAGDLGARPPGGTPLNSPVSMAQDTCGNILIGAKSNTLGGTLWQVAAGVPGVVAGTLGPPTLTAGATLAALACTLPGQPFGVAPAPGGGWYLGLNTFNGGSPGLVFLQ